MCNTRVVMWSQESEVGGFQPLVFSEWFKDGFMWGFSGAYGPITQNTRGNLLCAISGAMRRFSNFVSEFELD